MIFEQEDKELTFYYMLTLYLCINGKFLQKDIEYSKQI